MSQKKILLLAMAALIIAMLTSCGDKVNLFLTLRNGFGAEVLE